MLYIRGLKGECCDLVSNKIPLCDRKRLLSKIVKPERSRLELVSSVSSTNIDDIKRRFEDAVKNKEEGVIVKKENSVYLPGKRDPVWVKMKADYSENFTCDYDLAIIGAYFGQGRKVEPGADWVRSLSHFLVGLLVSDASQTKIEPLCKVASGLSMNDLSNIQQKMAGSLVRIDGKEKSGVEFPEYFSTTKFSSSDFPDA